MKSTFRKLVSVSIVTVMLVNMILACAVQATNAIEPVGTTGLSSEYTPPYVGWTGGRFIAPINAPNPNAVKIYTAQDLWNIRNNLSGSYVLMDDIDLSTINNGQWMPIGSSSNPFRGTFDGQGYVIHNLVITGDHNPAGLFGYVGTAIIANVGLEETKIYSSSAYPSYAGGLCGIVLGATISNCYNIGDVSSSYSSYSPPLSGTYSYAGGLCGYVEASYGLVTISNCYNTGDVTSSSLSSSDSSTGSYAGGLCGYVEAFSSSYGLVTISNCYNTGDVTSFSTDSYAGGLCGYVYPSSSGGLVEISNCYNRGAVTSSSYSPPLSGSTSYAGGLCGSVIRSYGLVTISNCYNIGNVSSSSDSIDSYAGGLCGSVYPYTGLVEISNCFTVCAVTSSSYYGRAYAGGLCGYVYRLSSLVILSNCYWCFEKEQKVNNDLQMPTRGVGYDGADTTNGLTFIDMMYKNSYVDWDFDNIWVLFDGGGYPNFRWEFPPDLSEKDLKDLFIAINAHSITILDQETFAPVRNAFVQINDTKYPPTADNGLVNAQLSVLIMFVYRQMGIGIMFSIIVFVQEKAEWSL